MLKHKYNIIFTDIDGVLLGGKFAEECIINENFDPFAHDYLDARSLRNLHHIVEATNAKIVLSGSWRWSDSALDAVKHQLQIMGMELFSTTSLDIDKRTTRTEEIQNWIDENKDSIKNYVILDDININIETPLKKHWIRCDYNAGLTHTDAEEAVSILLKKGI